MIQDSTSGHVFESIHLFLEECTTTFAYICMSLIELYVCFLRGGFEGQLMVAINKDENNKMTPISYAVVIIEIKNT